MYCSAHSSPRRPWLSRIIGSNFWDFYVSYGVFAGGWLLLWGLVLAEYAGLPSAHDAVVPDRAAAYAHPRLAAGILISIVSAVALVMLGGDNAGSEAGSGARPLRTRVGAPAGTRLLAEDIPVPSPDGSRVAIAAQAAGSETLLWIYSRDSRIARELRGTSGAAQPFWSPDGGQIGFFSQGQLRVVTLSSGNVRTLTTARNPHGGAWSTTGTIVFAPEADGPLHRIPESGGMSRATSRVRTSEGERGHRWPSFVDDVHFVYSAARLNEPSAGVFGSLIAADHEPTGEQSEDRVLYTAGHLLSRHGVRLSATVFHPERLERGPYSGGLCGGGYGLTGAPVFAASRNGLVSCWANLRVVQRFRTGRSQALSNRHDAFRQPQVSPDGRSVAVALDDAIEVIGVPSAASQRREIDGLASNPQWSRDGRRLAYAAERRGQTVLYVATASGGEPLAVVPLQAAWRLFTWDAQDRLVVEIRQPHTRIDLAILEPRAGAWGRPFLAGMAQERAPAVAPDGRQIAFVSDASGIDEVYVASYPDGRDIRQISSGGGDHPAWRRDGRELFFVASGHIKGVSMTGTSAAGTPVTVAPAPVSGDFAVFPDGQSFVVMEPDPNPSFFVLLDNAFDPRSAPRRPVWRSWIR